MQYGNLYANYKCYNNISNIVRGCEREIEWNIDLSIGKTQNVLSTDILLWSVDCELRIVYEKWRLERSMIYHLVWNVHNSGRLSRVENKIVISFSWSICMIYWRSRWLIQRMRCVLLSSSMLIEWIRHGIERNPKYFVGKGFSVIWVNRKLISHFPSHMCDAWMSECVWAFSAPLSLSPFVCWIERLAPNN